MVFHGEFAPPRNQAFDFHFRRRSRIARGSGTTTTDINQLLERFDGAQKMMRQMARSGGAPGLPGMGNLPGMGGKKSRGRTAAPAKKVKGRSGNPARRAEQERAAISGRPAAAPGSAFGLSGQPSGEPDQAKLAADLSKYLGG